MTSTFRFVCFLLLAASAARAEPPATRPSESGERGPVHIKAEKRADPPQRFWVVQIDLTDPRVKLKVVRAGEDPDGDGPWQTTLAPVSRIAKENELELAVNASFFYVDKQGPWAGKTYVLGQPAGACGQTTSDGRSWATTKPVNADWPVLWVDAKGKARVSDVSQVEAGAQQVVAGNAWLLCDGKADRTPTQGMIAVRHPRTAVGLNEDRTVLTILIVDGRRLLSAAGMTGEEMRAELVKHGVHNAINLDGGGSTTLVQKNEKGEIEILNNPSGNAERPVANVIGVDVAE